MMMATATAYVKLTDATGRTYGGQRWEPGVRVACGDPDAPMMPCSAGVIHCYAGATEAEALALAVLLDPNHGRFGAGARVARVWRFVPEGAVIDRGDKAICRAGCVTEELTAPQPTTEQHVEFGIRATLLVPQPDSYVEWAERWLSGADRSAAAAWQAAPDAAARKAANASGAWAAPDAAAWAAANASGAWATADAAVLAAAAARKAAPDAAGAPLPLAALALAVLEGRGRQWSDARSDRRR
jgi:hypothetical protein